MHRVEPTKPCCAYKAALSIAIKSNADSIRTLMFQALMASAAIVEGCKRRLFRCVTCGAQSPIRLSRAVIVGCVAGQPPPFHGKYLEMALGAVAFCRTEVTAVIEIHLAQSRCVMDRRRQRWQIATRNQFGMAPQAIILGGECRPALAMACSAGSLVLFRGGMQIVGVIQHAFCQRKDLVVAAAAISLADRYMPGVIELGRAHPRL
jgi:hypothetical protein